MKHFGLRQFGIRYLKSVVLAEEGSRENGNVEDDAHKIKNRQGEDELKERKFEVQS